MTEARFAAKLADMFDWMTRRREARQAFPRDLREGDKYIYTAVQFENPRLRLVEHEEEASASG